MAASQAQMKHTCRITAPEWLFSDLIGFVLYTRPVIATSMGSRAARSRSSARMRIIRERGCVHCVDALMPCRLHGYVPGESEKIFQSQVREPRSR